MNPTTEQQAIIDNAVRGKNIAITAYAGAGKCLGKGTLLTMADSGLRKVEDLQSGDTLLGVDGTPRTILSTTTGVEEMFRVIPTKGKPFECNRSHILSIKMSIRAGVRYRFRDGYVSHGDIVNLSVDEFLRQSVTFRKDAKLYVPERMDFLNTEQLSVPPYLLGLWLGDGNTESANITNPEPEVEEYLTALTGELNLPLGKRTPADRCVHFRLGSDGDHGTINEFNSMFRQLGVLGRKHIPLEYKFSSVEARMELLAGLLDSDGYYSKGYYEYITELPELATDIAFVARTLGFKVCISSKVVKKYPNNSYWRLSIMGRYLQDIPCKVSRKQAQARKQIKDPSVTGFSLVSLGVGEYYGFELDGDRLFLLEDFLVTHNTSTLTFVSKALTKNSLYIAFNKSIAEEASEKFPVWVTCRTLHSLAYEHIIRPDRMFKKVAGFSDTKAILKLLEDDLELYNDVRALEIVYQLLDCCKEFCQSSSFDMMEFTVSYFRDCGEEPEQVEILRDAFAKLWSAMIDPKHTLTMTHDVYLKLFQLSKPKLDYDVIYLDEGQDSNPVTLDIFYRQECQKIIVGDPYQAIYEWRGAVNAFESIPSDWVKLKLTESFRFTGQIAGIASKLLYIAGEDVPVQGLGKAKEDGSRAILCRTNIDILTHLLAAKNAREKVFVMADLQDLWSKLYHLQSLQAGSKPKYPNKQLKMFNSFDEFYKESKHSYELDKLLKFKNVLSGGEGMHANIVKIKEVIVEKEEDSDYTIATAHKSKGLEYDMVVLDSDILDLDQDGKEVHEILAEGQLLNLLYVAVTRARAVLSIPESVQELLANYASYRDDYVELVGRVL